MLIIKIFTLPLLLFFTANLFFSLLNNLKISAKKDVLFIIWLVVLHLFYFSSISLQILKLGISE
jgi:hypothetical protein